MAVKIVDEFEAVQIHQHQREGTSRARRALPFARERLHEEAMGFQAGHAVGDGLFLRFLEGHGVVQRAGNQVGQRSEEQNFFLGEIGGLVRLHVQHAMQLVGVHDRQRDRGIRTLQHRLARGVLRIVGHDRHLSRARDAPDDIAVQTQAPSQRALAAGPLRPGSRFPWPNNRAARFRCESSPAPVPALRAILASISSGLSVVMMLREMLLNRVRRRDLARSSRNSRAFSRAMTASLASTRIISRWP